MAVLSLSIGFNMQPPTGRWYSTTRKGQAKKNATTEVVAFSFAQRLGVTGLPLPGRYGAWYGALQRAQHAREVSERALLRWSPEEAPEDLF